MGKVNLSGQSMIAYDGNISKVVQCDSDGYLIVANNPASPVSKGVPKKFDQNFIAEAESDYDEYILASPPTGKAWIIYLVEIQSPDNVTVLNFSLNNNALGMYSSNNFYTYTLLDKFGPNGIVATHEDKISVFATNTNDVEANIVLSLYLREVDI